MGGGGVVCSTAKRLAPGNSEGGRCASSRTWRNMWSPSDHTQPRIDFIIIMKMIIMYTHVYLH